MYFFFAVIGFIGFIMGYPGGAPSCSSRPGHGINRGAIEIKIVKIAERKWKVEIPENHRGLLLRASGSSGLWYGHVPDYKDMGQCMTHISRKEKPGVTFIFRTHRDKVPQFTGFLVKDYKSYSTLESNNKYYQDITQKANDTALGIAFEKRLGISRKSDLDEEDTVEDYDENINEEDGNGYEGSLSSLGFGRTSLNRNRSPESNGIWGRENGYGDGRNTYGNGYFGNIRGRATNSKSEYGNSRNIFG